MSNFPQDGSVPTAERVYQPQKQLPPAKENGLGIAGFITSIIGLLTCGSISIFGVILSAIGLRKEPKGLAVAGLILGLVGIVELVAVGFIVLAGYRTTVAAVSSVQQMATSAQLEQQAGVIGDNWAESESLPDQDEGQALLNSMTDFWGSQVEYETDGETFSIRSLGPDRTPLTIDDVTAGPYASAEEAQSVGFENALEGLEGAEDMMGDMEKQMEEMMKKAEAELEKSAKEMEKLEKSNSN